MDPLAEKFLDSTPYNYVMNNPIAFIDPTGMAANTVRIDEVVVTEKKNANFNVLQSGRLLNWNQVDHQWIKKDVGIGTQQAVFFAAEQATWTLVPIGRIEL